jgi:hypothetical protein
MRWNMCKQEFLLDRVERCRSATIERFTSGDNGHGCDWCGLIPKGIHWTAGNNDICLVNTTFGLKGCFLKNSQVVVSRRDHGWGRNFLALVHFSPSIDSDVYLDRVWSMRISTEWVQE